MNVSFVGLADQFTEEREALMPRIERVLASGHWVGGSVVEALESDIAAKVGVKHCVAVNSGTDALTLGLACLGVRPGDEVITPPNSFVASTGCITHLGAKPVFIDVCDDQNLDPALLEGLISDKTKAIMPVHLTGRVCKMDKILEISERHGIPVIEDAAQAMGSRYGTSVAGSLGTVGCFSTHPLKNLNACGDGGLITTDSPEIDAQLRLMRNHGLKDRDTVARFGFVSRMDAIQAEILRFRLERMDDVIERRRANVAIYRDELEGHPNLFIPPCEPEEFNTFTLFMVQCDDRNNLKAYLSEHEIGTAIHYPIPIHLQPAISHLGFEYGSYPMTERQAQRILSLPNHPHISSVQIRYVCSIIKQFYAQ